MAFTSNRPPLAQRKFTSDAVEQTLRDVSSRIADPELAWLFSNCLPNTLDTTVSLSRDSSGRPDAFVITGDIPAMWLRDSTNQLWPYLPLAKSDPRLTDLFRGAIRRQAACVLLDPYANAFYRDPKLGEWQHDQTDMRPGVHERKYELDSLCAVLRLSAGYFRHTADPVPFDADWLRAVALIVTTIRHEQAGSDEQDWAYTFSRTTSQASDTLAQNGRGHPFRRTGMSRSPFRPSDDAHSLPFLVPANAMAVVCLHDLASVLDALKSSPDLAADARRLAAELDAGLRAHAIVSHPRHGRVFAYEVDGFGNAYLIDDANLPSLLSLPYLGYCAPSDPVYRATRALLLSTDNPYFARGTAGHGIGGPHVGADWVWPMSLITRALTSDDDAEITSCLRTLKSTHAGTGFMHESFHKDDSSRFTRPWFAWANSLFGELILTLDKTRPHLLRKPLD